MNPFALISAGAFLVTAAFLSVLHWKYSFDVSAVYGRFQAPLFTAFVTLGSFLFTLKSFILVQLKKEVYDSDEYKKHFKEVQEVQQTAKRYAPLKSLGQFLLYSVLSSLVTSAAQLTIGFIPHVAAHIVCFSLAACTLVLVFRAWLAIKQTLDVWFSQLDSMD